MATFMLNRKSSAGHLGALAIVVSQANDDNPEYYSLNEYTAACLVRYLLASLECPG